MTTPVIVAPEQLTFDHIRTWSGDVMKEQMRKPEMRDAILKVIASRNEAEVVAAQAEIEANSQPETPAVEEKTPEQLEAEQAQAAQYEAERQAAEQQRLAAEEAARKAAETPKKFVADYQIKDEDGNPIGRPTHLEAPTQEELQAKLIEAHTQATRAFHRLKKQKVSFKDQPQQPTQPSEMSDAELLTAMKDLKSDDPQKQLDAIRKVRQADEDKKNAEKAEYDRQQQVSHSFLVRHKNDFNNCQANIQLIQGYFEENKLQWTLDNLEIAFHDLESELAPVESVVSRVVDNPPTPTPAPVTPVAAPVAPAAPAVVQPTVSAPAQPAVVANPQPVAPRPGVNGGLVPGESSGSRPVPSQSKGLTAEEIKSWDGPTMRLKMKDPKIRTQIEAFLAARQKTRR